MAEGAPLLREYGLKAHRGFESLPLRQKTRAIGPFFGGEEGKYGEKPAGWYPSFLDSPSNHLLE